MKLDARQLLTIDVEAEVRKLAEAQTEGAFGLPVEIVRLLVDRGAREVDVGLRRSGLVVRGDGPGLDPSLLHDMAAIADARNPPAARHDALLRLEREATGLIALARLPCRRLELETPGHRYRRRGYRPPELTPSDRGRGTTVTVEGWRTDLGRTRHAVETACRFTSARIRIDGRPVSHGFADALAEARLAPPLSGVLAIPARGETARIWILQAGIVAAGLTLPGEPCFEAAVEVPGPVAGASQLREAMAPHIPTLVSTAIDLLRRAAERTADFDEGDERRLRHQLLAAARRHRRATAVLDLPLFPGLRGGEARRFSLLELAPGAAARTVLALHPGQDPRAYLTGQEPVVFLDAQERSHLTELLGLRFVPPPPRPSAGGPLHPLLEGLARLLDPRRGRALPDHLLSVEERVLLEALRKAGVEACLAEGRGPLRRRGDRWAIPRDNPLTVSAGRLLARDPSWAYPVALALVGDRHAPPAPRR